MPNCCGRWGQGIPAEPGTRQHRRHGGAGGRSERRRHRRRGPDVYESEPEPPAELLALDNLLLTPHVGGWSPESVEAQFTIYLQNLEGHFSGRGVVTPV